MSACTLPYFLPKIYHIPYTKRSYMILLTLLCTLHTRSYSSIYLYTHTLTSSYYSHPQWYVLKLNGAPSKNRTGKVNKRAFFQYSEHVRFHSWVEQDVYFELMAHSGHRCTPEMRCSEWLALVTYYMYLPKGPMTPSPFLGLSLCRSVPREIYLTVLSL